MGLFWMAFIMGTAVLLHELGHYLLARAQGIQVHQFSIGMGPVIFSRHYKGTDWCLSILPFGGYVLIDGMTPTEDEDGQPRRANHGFETRPLLGKIAILAAGPLMNFLLALLLLTTLFSVRGSDVTDRMRITEVLPSSVAQQVGVRVGDVIMLPKEKDIHSFGKQFETSGTKKLQVLRDQQPLEISFQWNHQQRLFGVRYEPERVKLPVHQALGRSLQQSASIVPIAMNSFTQLGTAFLSMDIRTDDGIRGPLGTAETVSKAATINDPWILVVIAAVINLSIAIFNLLPIPVLDGGRMLIIILQALFRRRLSLSQENNIMIISAIFMAVLTLFVLIKDIVRIASL